MDMAQAKLIGTGITLLMAVVSAYGLIRVIRDKKVSAGPLGWKTKEEAPLFYWFFLTVWALTFVGAIFMAFQLNKL